MPRGFLVKRTRRPCGSYRIPCEDPGPPQALPTPSALDTGLPYDAEKDKQPPSPPATHPGSSAELSPLSPGHWHQLPYSPTGVDMKKSFFRRYLRSPPDPFPAALTSMEKMLSPHHPFLTPDSKLQPNFCPRSPKQPLPPKKPKASRKLHFTDEVTTSPVLGLKIKAEEPGAVTPGPRRPPLGEFICQLCKEQYPDPFSLAQHKCSRIVRVEYRCPECDKIFSCPANLASHRRWHKPRNVGTDGQVGKKLLLEGKENSSGRGSAPHTELSSRLQHPPSVDSDQHLHPGNSALHTPADEGDEEAFHCPYCRKRFRRHAYLRKHLLTHQPYGPAEPGYPCALCGVHFPSMDIRDKHRLWHAVREELLLPLEEALVAEGGQQIFPCEFCPTAFFSGPGLSLHISKCHSPEGRADLALPTTPLPLRPGC